jgi:hypothetical protein
MCGGLWHELHQALGAPQRRWLSDALRGRILRVSAIGACYSAAVRRIQQALVTGPAGSSVGSAALLQPSGRNHIAPCEAE